MALTPIKAIRAHFLECSCGNRAEVKACPIKNCALYPYRMGHRPKVEESSTEGGRIENTPTFPGVTEQERALEEESVENGKDV